MNPELLIEFSWREHLQTELKKEYFTTLWKKVSNERNRGRTVFPKELDVFRAFSETPFESVRVVILGQDPYHQMNQAHGLAFSVPDGVPHPPSLRNIFQELAEDIGCSVPKSGDLSKWARQGVLLLNSSLTVEENAPLSHQAFGWDQFTMRVLEILYREHKAPLIFVLWGGSAQTVWKKLLECVGREKRSDHVVFSSAHPSPLSSYRGFFGSKPFSKINQQLTHWGHPPIHWG